jgi:hypothetical protein
VVAQLERFRKGTFKQYTPDTAVRTQCVLCIRRKTTSSPMWHVCANAHSTLCMRIWIRVHSTHHTIRIKRTPLWRAHDVHYPHVCMDLLAYDAPYESRVHSSRSSLDHCHQLFIWNPDELGDESCVAYLAIAIDRDRDSV